MSRSPHAGTFASGSEEMKGVHNDKKEGKKPSSERCPLCKNRHNLDVCERFNKMSQTERRDFVKSNGLCLGCLKYGHIKRDCRGKKVCTTCKGFHPTSLHIDSPRLLEQSPKPVTGLQNITPKVNSHRVNSQDTRSLSICNSHSLIVPVWLHHKNNPERELLVYALLDDQSDACLVKDDILHELDVTGPDVQLKLSTVLG